MPDTSNPLLPRPGEIWTHRGLKVLAYVIDLQSTDRGDIFDFHFLNLCTGKLGTVMLFSTSPGTVWSKFYI